MMLPPHASWLGRCSLACKPPLFPRNITMVTMANSSIFVSSDQRTFLQKVRSLSPCAVANRSLTFLWWFWSSGFFLSEQPFRLCQHRTHFTVDIFTTYAKVFGRRSAVDVTGFLAIAAPFFLYPLFFSCSLHPQEGRAYPPSSHASRGELWSGQTPCGAVFDHPPEGRAVGERLFCLRQGTRSAQDFAL